MRLKYSLYPNPFRKKEYMASVQPDRISTLDNVLRDMARRSRRYSAAELQGIFSLFLETVDGLLKENHHIHLPFLKITTSISGKFTGEQDHYDPKRHRVNVKVNPGKNLTAIAQEIKVQKVEPTRPSPQIGRIVDFGQQQAGVLTPGSPAEVRGKHLRLDDGCPEQGLFLVSAGQPEVRITEVYQNSGTRLLFRVPPDVSLGSYHLLVRTTVGNSTELRQGVSARPLLVQVFAPGE